MGLRDKFRGLVGSKPAADKETTRAKSSHKISEHSPTPVDIPRDGQEGQIPQLSDPTPGDRSDNPEKTSGEPAGLGVQAEDSVAEDASAGRNHSLDGQAEHEARSGDPLGTEESDEKWLEYQDVWSQAYFEALQSLTDPKEREIMKTSNGVTDLFANLEKTNKQNFEDSLFRRGLKKIQQPLKGLKFALSMASPLSSMDPTVSTAFGIVSSVSAIAIGIAGADVKFGDQVEEMLKQLSIIDECDTISQQSSDMPHIHKALVKVYRDMINFFLAARACLMSSVVVLSIVKNQLDETVPETIDAFNKDAGDLRKRIENATLALVNSIKQLLIDEKIERLLGQAIDQERRTFHRDQCSLRTDEACEWILNEQAYMSWVKFTSSGIFSLHGQLGCGKTVTTSFVIDQVLGKSKQTLPQSFVCFHYCRDAQESSTFVGILNSFTSQLLEQKKSFRLEFNQWHEKTKNEKRIDPVRSDELANFLRQCLQRLDRRLVIVLDGLDECDVLSQEKLVGLMKELCQSNKRLAVMISYRFQDYIHKLLSDCSSDVQLLTSLTRDRVIVKHTVEAKLSRFPRAAQDFLIDELSQRANGSGIWVRIMVEYIGKVNSQTVPRLKILVADASPPEELSKLYAKLFDQMTQDNESNVTLLTAALEMLTAARRPLKLSELAYAVAIDDIERDGQFTLEELEELVEVDRVFGLVYPFVTVSSPKQGDKEVKLVHQSAKEFVLGDLHPHLDGEGDSMIEKKKKKKNRKDLVERRKSELEGQLLGRCVRYLLIEEFGVIESELEDKEEFLRLGVAKLEYDDDQQDEENDEEDGFLGIGMDSDGDAESEEAVAKEPKEAESEEEENLPRFFDPAELGFGKFYAYAASFWLDHFRESPTDLHPCYEDQVELSRCESQRMRNWVDQYCRPECTIAKQLFLNSNSLDPLSIQVLYGSPESLASFLQEAEVLDTSKFSNSSLENAIRNMCRENLSMLRVLFEDEKLKGKTHTLDFFSSLTYNWSNQTSSDHGVDENSQSWTEAFELIRQISPETIAKQGWANQIFTNAAEVGCLPLLRILADTAESDAVFSKALFAPVEREDYQYQSVAAAIRFRHLEAVRFLLDLEGIEAHLRSKTSKGDNVFHVAAFFFRLPDLMRLLVSKFPDGVDVRANDLSTPLEMLVADSFKGGALLAECVEVLLDNGASVLSASDEADYDGYSDPLRKVVREFNQDLVRLLVRKGGADPSCALKEDTPGSGKLVLRDAVYRPIDPEELERWKQEMVDLLVSLQN